MKMVIRNGQSTIKCQISAAKELHFYSQKPCDLEEDTVSYAACRFFSKSAALCKLYAAESYRMRLAQGRGRKSKKHQCILPAQFMELPGNWARIHFTVDPVGVTIRGIDLLERFPGAVDDTGIANAGTTKV